MERLYKHQIFGREKLPEVKPGTPRLPYAQRAKTVGSFDQPDNIKKWKKILPVTYFYSNTKTDRLKEQCSIESQQQCAIEETEMNEESITVADVNGSTDKTVDVNENTVEVTLHVAPEAEHTSTVNGESDSPSL